MGNPLPTLRKLTAKVKKTQQHNNSHLPFPALSAKQEEQSINTTIHTTSCIMIDDSLISILGGMKPRLQEKCLFALVLLGVFAIFLAICFSKCLFALMLLGVVIAIFFGNLLQHVPRSFGVAGG